jgi:hypothetical protein
VLDFYRAQISEPKAQHNGGTARPATAAARDGAGMIEREDRPLSP